MVERQDPDASPAPEPLSFEEAFRRLSETVAALEQGGLPLEQTTALYEQGMSLVQQCNGLLNEAELKITQLQDNYSAHEPDFDPDLDWDDVPEP